jgi:hypothetical protein
MSKGDAQMTARREDQRSKAEELLSRREKKEAERLSERERQSKALDEKTARLRALRLAKEAAERSAPKQRRPR